MRFAPTPGSFGRAHGDRAGDPLDGLVNLFDLSLVLAVGFLLAALSALGATSLLTANDGQIGGGGGKVLPGAPPLSGTTADGRGQQVGSVYRLDDGRYVFVPSGAAAGGATGATGGATGATGGATGATAGSTGSTGATGGSTTGGGSTAGSTGSGTPPASTTTSPATATPTT